MVKKSTPRGHLFLSYILQMLTASRKNTTKVLLATFKVGLSIWLVLHKYCFPTELNRSGHSQVKEGTRPVFKFLTFMCSDGCSKLSLKAHSFWVAFWFSSCLR